MRAANWADFKDICIVKKNLNLQCEEAEGSWHIVGPDGNNINWEIDLPKLLPDPQSPGQTIPNPDVADFIATVKPACNFAIGARSYASATGDFQADDDSMSGTFLKAEDAQTPKITDLYYKFDHLLRVSGGEYWTTGAQRGDKVQVDIVDKDGVITMPDYVADIYQVPHGTKFPAGSVLNAYIRSRRLCPVDNQIRSFQRAYWGSPPVNSYLRVRGVIANTVNDVTFDLNIFLHKPI